MNLLLNLSILLLAFSVSNATYSKYGRTCSDIGCMSNEECVMEEDVCTLKSRGHCGTYPACKRVSSKKNSCASYTCPPTQECTMKNNKPRCVDSGSSKTKRQVQSYNTGGYNPSAPYPSNQGAHIYPSLPGYQGGNTGHGGYNTNHSGSHYPGQQYPGQTYPGQSHTGQTYPGQTYPGQTYPGQTQPGQTYPGQTYPGQTYPGQHQPGQTYPGQNYPGQTTTYPGQTYPGQQHPGQTYPGQTYPGQTHPGQTYPGQTYPGQHNPGQQYPGQTYPNQQGGTSGDFYKDQTRNPSNQNYNPPRRYKRASQSHNYGSNLYNSSGVYNQQGVKGGHSPSPGGNTYPIPPGYTGHHYSPPHHHSGSSYPSQHSGQTHPGHQSGQTYPSHQTSETYPGQHTGQTYPSHQTGQTYPGQHTGQTYPSHQTGQTYPAHQTGQTYPAHQSGQTYPSHQTGQTYPSQQTGQTYPSQQHGQTYPSRPNYTHQQTNQNQSVNRYPGSSSGQHTYPSPTSSSHQSNSGRGSQSNHQTHPNQPSQSDNKDFYQSQTKNTQTHNQAAQYPNYNQNQGRRYSRSIQNSGYNQNYNHAPSAPSNNGYNHYPTNYPYNQNLYPQLPSNYYTTTPRYPGYGGGAVGSGYPHQGHQNLAKIETYRQSTYPGETRSQSYSGQVLLSQNFLRIFQANPSPDTTERDTSRKDFLNHKEGALDDFDQHQTSTQVHNSSISYANYHRNPEKRIYRSVQRFDREQHINLASRAPYNTRNTYNSHYEPFTSRPLESFDNSAGSQQAWNQRNLGLQYANNLSRAPYNRQSTYNYHARYYSPNDQQWFFLNNTDQSKPYWYQGRIDNNYTPYTNNNPEFEYKNYSPHNKYNYYNNGYSSTNSTSDQTDQHNFPKFNISYNNSPYYTESSYVIEHLSSTPSTLNWNSGTNFFEALVNIF